MQVSIETMQRIINDSPDIAKRILPDIIRRRLIEARIELDDLGHLLSQVVDIEAENEAEPQETILKHMDDRWKKKTEEIVPNISPDAAGDISHTGKPKSTIDILNSIYGTFY